jgi:hypothetical protein
MISIEAGILPLSFEGSRLDDELYSTDDRITLAARWGMRREKECPIDFLLGEAIEWQIRRHLFDN